MSLGVLNYNAGNLTSVESALRFLNADFFVSSDPEQLMKADSLIFPGVGEASYAMKELQKSGNGEMLKEFIKSGKSLLGICLGAQILFSETDERETACLDILKGKVRKFDPSYQLKIPHMGWNNVSTREDAILFKGIPQESSFYFVHSYYIEAKEDSIISGKTDYGIKFCSAVQSNNIYACQFHPEKSGKHGLKMLSNFINLA